MVYCVGETLLDVVQSLSETENSKKDEKHRGIPGGAMLNTAVSLARAGIPVSLVSELGDDDVAGFIIDFLNENGVNTRWVRQYAHMKTSVAFAVLDENKKAIYRFEKHYPGLRRLMPVPDFNKTDVLLFGSLYSLEENIRDELLKILNTAHHSDITIMYDPNIRQDHIIEGSAQWQKVIENIKMADVIKASDEDLMTLFGQQSPERLLRSVRDINPRALVIMTMGADGLLCLWKDEVIGMPAQRIKIESTVGAGDGFNAGMIYGWIKQAYSVKELQTFGSGSIKKFLQQGVSFASVFCTPYANYIPPGWRPCVG